MNGPGSRFRQRITYTHKSGFNGHGDPTYAPNETAPARVQPSRRLIRTASGDEVMSSHVVYTSAPIALKSRVWFPDDDDTDIENARAPIGIDEHVNGDGVTVYKKVWF